jgi:hypothetical protein
MKRKDKKNVLYFLLNIGLPMVINNIFILSKTAGGDEVAAIVNSSLVNLTGIFPLLIL